MFFSLRSGNMDDNTIIAAPGTSCRHHIKDGTGRIALHPAVVLYDALVQGTQGAGRLADRQ